MDAVRDKQAEMEQIAQEVEQLTESPLHAYRQENDYHTVMGEGSLDAKIMFIGEAPGEREAKSGRPFVGASGHMLNGLLHAAGIKREDVYISNVVKDRPPNNRNPHKKEIQLYRPFLLRQIEVIQPQVIATLGRFAMEFILEEFNSPADGGKISQIHGSVQEGETSYGKIAIVPLFHPAVALYNENQKETLTEDFQVLKQFL